MHNSSMYYYQPFERVYSNWEEWFAWYPVKVNNEWRWFSKVYRRWSRLFGALTSSAAAYYQYGTIFDVLQKTENKVNPPPRKP